MPKVVTMLLLLLGAKPYAVVHHLAENEIEDYILKTSAQSPLLPIRHSERGKAE